MAAAAHSSLRAWKLGFGLVSFLFLGGCATGTDISGPVFTPTVLGLVGELPPSVYETTLVDAATLVKVPADRSRSYYKIGPP